MKINNNINRFLETIGILDKNVNFDSKTFFQNSTPYTFLQSLLFFF